MALLEQRFVSAQLLCFGRSSSASTLQKFAASFSRSSNVKALNEISGFGFPERCDHKRLSSKGSHFSRIAYKGVKPLSSQIEDQIFLLSDFEGGGPVELPPQDIAIDPLAIPEATPVQVVASIFLTGTIVVLLYRSLRRRASRAKEMQFRASGVNTAKSIKEQARKAALQNLTKAPEIRTIPPSPAQTAFGAVIAGVIALGLYKFTTTVEASFLDKAVSQNYSIRNLTITIRTIITGLCYLATFVFAANSVGLALYSIQLLLGSVPSGPPVDESPSKEDSTPEARTIEEAEAEDPKEKES